MEEPSLLKVFNDMESLMLERGWRQGSYGKDNGLSICPVTALEISSPNRKVARRAYVILKKAIKEAGYILPFGILGFWKVECWNDRFNTRFGDVLNVLAKAKEISLRMGFADEPKRKIIAPEEDPLETPAPFPRREQPSEEPLEDPIPDYVPDEKPEPVPA